MQGESFALMNSELTSHTFACSVQTSFAVIGKLPASVTQRDGTQWSWASQFSWGHQMLEEHKCIWRVIVAEINRVVAPTQAPSSFVFNAAQVGGCTHSSFMVPANSNKT